MEKDAQKKPAAKCRVDKLLVDGGLAASRERAQALILAGRVLVNEQKVDKPGATVQADANVRLLGDDLRYVSRGGLKLEGALKAWDIDLAGRACADIGASTGGFTDCMLQHGAASVLAVDTGYGQIAHRLRTDPRVMLMERTNARKLEPGELAGLASREADESDRGGPGGAGRGEQRLSAGARISFFAMDVSFISATLVLPAVVGALAPAGTRWEGEAVMLVKPQFEAGREHVGKGGIVRDPAAQKLAVDRVCSSVRDQGGEVAGVIDSPILGMEGNREFLLHAFFGRGTPAF